MIPIAQSGCLASTSNHPRIRRPAAPTSSTERGIPAVRSGGSVARRLLPDGAVGNCPVAVAAGSVRTNADVAGQSTGSSNRRASGAPVHQETVWSQPSRTMVPVGSLMRPTRVTPDPRTYSIKAARSGSRDREGPYP